MLAHTEPVAQPGVCEWMFVEIEASKASIWRGGKWAGAFQANLGGRRNLALLQRVGEEHLMKTDSLYRAVRIQKLLRQSFRKF